MTQTKNIKDLITRLARIEAGASWGDDLNPAQRMTLEYLNNANRFSRSPSHAAAYLGTTRGTITQTLKSLARKGYVAEERSESDKRSISYSLTNTGQKIVNQQGILERAIEKTPSMLRAEIDAGLRDILSQALQLNGQKAFGICKYCRHFETTTADGYCGLLSLALTPTEALQICHEQEPT
ncbi:MarR family winged helix-turn-helix transcriptional regulator [Cochlodiniinecator piscidefendens]|uniref:MarR family winged helix-turn-helix transcriptional regulator n=1 Tax=Cochlodiniinecator piscidefendens TaxID=2715756 RepID=UPI00140794A2|nr:MarR family transcriptional regulator [Cochlodiniinecator piscidefendens]